MLAIICAGDYVAIVMPATPFTIARCPTCEAEVLTYSDLSDDQSLFQRCIDCDTPITQGLTKIAGSELDHHGYELNDGSGAGGGCGGGCGSSCGVKPASPSTT